MKALAVAMALILAGCANIGRPIANTGQTLGRSASVVAGSPQIFAPPVLFLIWLPLITVGCPVYYLGCAIAGERPECAPFNP